jgi:cytochrome c oxidase subunit 2
MRQAFPLFPEQASTIAQGVDALFGFLAAVSLFFSVLIFAFVFYFAIRYRRISDDERPQPIIGSLRLELFWTIGPFLITLVMFGWGASLYFANARAPVRAVDIYVVGKQWMWKLQHPEGIREINELHVPVRTPVRLTMTSEDVIHSFYVPAFRIKMDVLPGRYTSAWFEATKPGEYHLFCAEYCGNKHSAMIGKVIVMEPVDYENWLGGGSSREPLEITGGKLFERLGCVNCHQAKGTGRGPSLANVFGQQVKLEGGQTVTADEGYLRESMLNPGAKVVAGYPLIMPTFQGQITEEGLLQIISYIKSLSKAERTAPAQ